MGALVLIKKRVKKEMLRTFLSANSNTKRKMKIKIKMILVKVMKEAETLWIKLIMLI